MKQKISIQVRIYLLLSFRQLIFFFLFQQVSSQINSLVKTVGFSVLVAIFFAVSRLFSCAMGQIIPAWGSGKQSGVFSVIGVFLPSNQPELPLAGTAMEGRKTGFKKEKGSQFPFHP